jgi:hypothetical protein
MAARSREIGTGHALCALRGPEFEFGQPGAPRPPGSALRRSAAAHSLPIAALLVLALLVRAWCPWTRFSQNASARMALPCSATTQSPPLRPPSPGNTRGYASPRDWDGTRPVRSAWAHASCAGQNWGASESCLSMKPSPAFAVHIGQVIVPRWVLGLLPLIANGAERRAGGVRLPRPCSRSVGCDNNN